MADLIDRGKLIDHIMETYSDWCVKPVRPIFDFISGMPSAERHGKWIIRDNPGTGWYRVTCSQCGEDVTSVVPVIGFFPKAKVTWDFCPECGARMDGD